LVRIQRKQINKYSLCARQKNERTFCLPEVYF
jgi:hypothetical protein